MIFTFSLLTKYLKLKIMAESEVENADLLTEGIITSLKPSIEELDGSIMSLRQSQAKLKHNIETLSEEIKAFYNFEPNYDIEACLKKLMNSRRRVMLVNNILQNSQERLNRIHNGIAREMAKKKAQLPPDE